VVISAARSHTASAVVGPAPAVATDSFSWPFLRVAPTIEFACALIMATTL
jgi:hypothetical protein